MDLDRGLGREVPRVGAQVVAREGDPRAFAELRDWYQALPAHDIVTPLPPRVDVMDGVRHVYLRDSREEEFARFLEMARSLQVPIEIGLATVYKREGDWDGESVKAQPFEVVHGTPQALTNGGVSLLWQYSQGNGTTTADQTLTYLTNARAALGVGDSTTAFAATQNDLVAATNKLRKAMDATYPLHTDGTTTAAQTITFQSTFATGDANWVWNEWVIANSATAATGRILNRKVEGLGTKVSTATWTLQVTVTIS